RDAQTTVGQHARHNRRGKDFGQIGTRASAQIAFAANAAAIGFDFDFDDLGVFLVAAWREGLATARATGLVGRQDVFFSEDGQVGIVAAFGNGVALLLAPFASRVDRTRRSSASLGGRGILS